ncbi:MULTISPECIES: hypothetical protein [unclassified Flammeovirga]|uniref:hypothetical protein n=1 Tax=unclassified Flammeovirga TaxID=2637820 RepID=UPI0012E08573|nr:MULTISPECIES: hypothetical protein [unclassified Flammeovirga]MBD0404364.1 hypothetical protein [Flammeovirga sp. EKP202]
MIAKVKYTVAQKEGILAVICRPTDTVKTILKKAKTMLVRSGHIASSIQQLNFLSKV